MCSQDNRTLAGTLGGAWFHPVTLIDLLNTAEQLTDWEVLDFLKRDEGCSTTTQALKEWGESSLWGMKEGSPWLRYQSKSPKPAPLSDTLADTLSYLIPFHVPVFLGECKSSQSH